MNIYGRQAVGLTAAGPDEVPLSSSSVLFNHKGSKVIIISHHRFLTFH